ncbi:MAG: efflux RND transporter permease subunit [Burkholderiaceae bacterium]|jgi:multidrug efflux pump subunit AcrB|nr:efflux RND transporter permease subunit [Burkholderiaceae bacterium]
MKLNVSAWSIRNPIPAILLFVLLTLAGVLAFHAMKVQRFPDTDLPVVTVSAVLPGAAPTQLESDVARKLENAIATVQGLKHITTRIQDGQVTLLTEFQLEKPMQEAVDDVRSAVQRVRADLPQDVRDPIINKLDLAGMPVLTYAVASTGMDDEQLSWFVDNDITKKLLALPGVGAVNRVGGVTREVHVDLDPLKLQALGVTAAAISRQLRQVQLESAGGHADIGASEQPVRTLATVQTADQLARLQIPLTDGRRIRLDQVATVTDTIAKPRAAALLDGKPVIGFEVSRSRGASEIDVGREVQRALGQMSAQRPDLRLTKAFDFVEPVQDEYDGSMHLLYEGALLAVLVVWLFLRDWRATIISAVALPMSVLPAFIGMALMHFSINVVTLLALSLVIGVLVDDAIVEVENIVRHLRAGKTPWQAALEAADEIGLAVVATSFTLIAVFLPTAFMSGIAGMFFKQFGWTAAFAVFASLVVARMLTPMMAAYLLKPAQSAPREPSWLALYMRAVNGCLRHRLLTVVLALLFFIVSLGATNFLKKDFMSPDDSSQTQVHLALPPGATLAQTLAAAEQTRQRLLKIAHIQNVYTAVGGGAAGGDPLASIGAPETRKATLTIQLDPRNKRPRKRIIENQIRAALETLPGVRSAVGLGGSGEKYILVLAGDDPIALESTGRAVEKELRGLPGLGNIASTASLVRPEILVRPDFARAAELGVTSSAMAETLRVATVGDYDYALPKLNLAQRQIPIIVKLRDDARQDLAQLMRLQVPSPHGPVMLEQVATLALAGGPSAISRYDRVRNVNFEIELSGVSLSDAKAAVMALPSMRKLPASVHVVDVADAEMMAELFSSFALAMLIGVLCIYAVLVVLFKDFLHPITLLCALPLALGGAFGPLLVTGQALSMASLIGLIMLMGIATKNSILLIEYAIVARRDHGLSRLEALRDACHKRARPIIMTTLAMGAGMLPIALGLGAADPSFRSPMAITVIGGLMTSTALSLLVVPAVFTYIDDFKNWVTRKFGRAR